MTEHRRVRDGEDEASRVVSRFYAGRFALLAAGLALLAGLLFWRIPAGFALFAATLMLATTALLPRRRLTRRVDAAQPGSPWPDTSMKAIVEALPMAAMVLDGDLVVRFANGRASRQFATTRPGDPFRLTFRSPEASAALAAVRRHGDATMEYREVGEKSRVYNVTFSRIGRPSHAGNHILVVFDDASERLAIARMRADFVANASHELRTPLASLTGFIETLLGPARSDPEATQRFLAIMLDQARRMGRLIDDLLSLSRVEMRVHKMPTEAVDLANVLRSVADALAVVAAEHQVVLDLQLQDDRVRVPGEHDELVQVFQNLVENAIRYGGSGGRVEIALRRSDDGAGKVEASVRDFGPGIPAEHLPRLTERFYRVDVASSRAMKGTGLGLAIVKHILTRHQARLDIESEVGKGALFRVEFSEILAPGVKREAAPTT